MPVIAGQPACETFSPPPGALAPLPSWHFSFAFSCPQRSCCADAVPAAMPARRMARVTACLRMRASLASPPHRVERIQTNGGALWRGLAVLRVALDQRRGNFVTDRRVSNQLDPRELAPVVVVAVDGQRAGGVRPQPRDARGNAALALVVDSREDRFPDQRERDRL